MVLDCVALFILKTMFSNIQKISSTVSAVRSTISHKPVFTTLFKAVRIPCNSFGRFLRYKASSTLSFCKGQENNGKFFSFCLSFHF